MLSVEWTSATFIVTKLFIPTYCCVSIQRVNVATRNIPIQFSGLIRSDTTGLRTTYSSVMYTYTYYL